MDLGWFPEDLMGPVIFKWKSRVLYIVGILLLVNFLARHVISYRRMRVFRGSFWASVTQLWLFQKTAKGIANTEVRKITEKYGKSYFALSRAVVTIIGCSLHAVRLTRCH
jgi:hypothetical protein